MGFQFARTLKAWDINDTTKRRKIRYVMKVSDKSHAKFEIDGHEVDRWIFEIFLQMASVGKDSELKSDHELPPAPSEQPGRDREAVRSEPAERPDGSGGA